MIESEWKKEQGKFGIGFILSTFFFIFSFFSTPIYQNNELVIEEMVFKSAEFHGGKIDNVEITFLGEKDEFEINRIEKEYLNKPLFKKIKYGDTINVSHVDQDVFRIKFQGIELMNKEKADIHKRQNRMFVRFISLTGMIFFIIPAFFEEQPIFKIFRRHYVLKLDKYSVGLLILLIIIVAYLVGNPNPEL
jgi:hypothetical protein